ncbi:hypothetical protein CE91St41_01320 [Oscillospiraceae bacterium]|nr:hypothetical protein CE91St40_01320 [Oscillospiraceae bacterium]BDF73243.1 hypothetical protein CE91St41_01320 [Oscillospiraceae bacterium]
MDIAFLKALYYACSNPSGQTALLPLHARYLDLTEPQRVLCRLYALLGDDVADDLDCTIGECATAYELQGFVNGFRYGAMLAGELAGDFPRQLWHPETPLGET